LARLVLITARHIIALVSETIWANLERVVAAHPEIDALIDVGQGLRHTYAEIDVVVESFR
jgi:fatty-acyl-CoA synthase